MEKPVTPGSKGENPGGTKKVPSNTAPSRELLRDLSFYVPSKLVPAVLGFVVVIVLTHSLATEEYGNYATIVATATLADTLAFAWLRQSILRYYPDYQEQKKTKEFQAHILPILLWISMVAMVIASIALAILGYNAVHIFSTIFIIITAIPLNFLTTLYQSHRFAQSYAVATLLQSSLQIGWILALVYLQESGYVAAVSAIAVGNLGAILYLITRRAKTGIYSNLRFGPMDLPLTKKLVAYGFPMSVWLLSLQILVQANRLIIGLLRTQDEVGIYSSSYDLINGSLSLIMTPFLLAAHPLIMQMWAKAHDRYEIEQLISGVTRYILLLCIPIFFFAIIVNEDIFFLLGENYGVTGWVVPVLVMGTFVGQFSNYFHKGLEVTGQTKVMLRVGLVTAVLNIVLNLVFVEEHGYEASALISLCSFLFYAVVVYRFSRHNIRVLIPWRSVLRVGSSALLACLCWLILKDVDSTGTSTPPVLLLVYSCVSAIVYAFSLLISGEIAPEVSGFRGWIAQHHLRQNAPDGDSDL